MTDDKNEATTTQGTPQVPVALKRRKVVSVESYKQAREGRFGKKVVQVRPHIREQEVRDSEPQKSSSVLSIFRRRKQKSESQLASEEAAALHAALGGR